MHCRLLLGEAQKSACAFCVRHKHKQCHREYFQSCQNLQPLITFSNFKPLIRSDFNYKSKQTGKGKLHPSNFQTSKDKILNFYISLFFSLTKAVESTLASTLRIFEATRNSVHYVCLFLCPAGGWIHRHQGYIFSSNGINFSSAQNIKVRDFFPRQTPIRMKFYKQT